MIPIDLIRYSGQSGLSLIATMIRFPMTLDAKTVRTAVLSQAIEKRSPLAP